MKIIIITILFICIYIILISKPAITFDSLVHDFGKINEEEGPYNFNFIFSNTGDESLRLEKVKAVWGCTTPSWSTDELEPGQTGFIEVQFDPTDRPGKFSKIIRVNTNINNEIVILTIRGKVLPTPGKFRNRIGPLLVTNNFIDFNDIIFGTNIIKKIEIQNSTEEVMYIKCSNTPEHIKINFEPEILDSCQVGEMIILVDSKRCDFGKSIDIIKLNIKLNEDMYQGNFSILTNIVEDFSILTTQELAKSPQIFILNRMIDFGQVKPDELKTKKIEFENKGKRDLYIRNVKISNKLFSINPSKFIIKPGEKGLIQINVKPTPERNNMSAMLTIISNDPYHSVIKLRIIGSVK